MPENERPDPGETEMQNIRGGTEDKTVDRDSEDETNKDAQGESAPA